MSTQLFARKTDHLAGYLQKLGGQTLPFRHWSTKWVSCDKHELRYYNSSFEPSETNSSPLILPFRRKVSTNARKSFLLKNCTVTFLEKGYIMKLHHADPHPHMLQYTATFRCTDKEQYLMWSTYLNDTILRCKKESSIYSNIAIAKRLQQIKSKLQFTSFSVIRFLTLGIAASSLCILGIFFRKQKKGVCDPGNISIKNSENFYGNCSGLRDLKHLENSDLEEAKRILWYQWIIVFCSSAVVIFEVALYMRSSEYIPSVGRAAAYFKKMLRFGNNVDQLNVALHRYISSNEYIQSVGRTAAYVKELLRFGKTVNESKAVPQSIQPQSLSTEGDSEGETGFDEYGPSIQRAKNSNDTYRSFYDSNHESEVDKYHGDAISLQSDLCNLEPDERSENDRINQTSELSAGVAEGNEISQVGASSTQHPQHVGHTNQMDLCQSPPKKVPPELPSRENSAARSASAARAANSSTSPSPSAGGGAVVGGTEPLPIMAVATEKETEDESGLLPSSSQSKTIGDNDTQSQGWLWIKPPKQEDPSVKRSWQKVWVKLVTSSFPKGCCLEIYYDDSQTKKLRIVDLHRCAVYHDKEEKYKHYGKYVFDILKVFGKEKESLMAPSEEKRTEWIDAIGRATVRIDIGGWLWWKPRKSDEPSVAWTWQKTWVNLVASSKPANCYVLVFRDDTGDDLLSSIELHGCAVYHDEKERYKQNGKFMFDIIDIYQGSQSLMTSTEEERSEWVDAIECIAKLGGNI